MKLRLPHKFQTALMAALASVSITTLSTGTIAVATGAALLAGQQAQAADEELTTFTTTNSTTTTTKNYNAKGFAVVLNGPRLTTTPTTTYDLVYLDSITLGSLRAVPAAGVTLALADANGKVLSLSENIVSSVNQSVTWTFENTIVATDSTLYFYWLDSSKAIAVGNTLSDSDLASWTNAGSGNNGVSDYNGISGVATDNTSCGYLDSLSHIQTQNSRFAPKLTIVTSGPVPQAEYIWKATGTPAYWDEVTNNWTLRDVESPYTSGVDTIVNFNDGAFAKEVTVVGAIEAGTVNVGANYEFTVGSGASLSISKLSVASGAKVTVENAGELSLAKVTGAGALEVGAGTVNLSAGNDFSGGLTVSGGVVHATQVSALGTGTLTATGTGVIEIENTAPGNLTVAGDGTLRLITTYADASQQSNVELGDIHAANLSLAADEHHSSRFRNQNNPDLSGVGHLYFDGGQLWVSNAFTYGGAVTFNETVYKERRGQSDALNDAALRVNANVTLTGKVDVAHDTKFTWQASNLAVEFGGEVVGSGNLELAIYAGSGNTFRIGGDASAYAGSITSASGVALDITNTGKLSIGSSSNLAGAVSLAGQLNVNGGAIISGALSGAGTLAKVGTGTFTLSNNYTGFTGNVGVQEGTLALGSTGEHTLNQMTLAGGELSIGSGLIVTPTAGVSVTGNSTLTVDGTLKLSSTSPLQVNNAALTLAGSGTIDLGDMELKDGESYKIKGDPTVRDPHNGFTVTSGYVEFATLTGTASITGGTQLKFTRDGGEGAIDPENTTHVKFAGNANYGTFSITLGTETLSEIREWSKAGGETPQVQNIELSGGAQLNVDETMAASMLAPVSGATKGTVNITSTGTFTSDGDARNITITGAGTYALTKTTAGAKWFTAPMIDTLDATNWTGTVKLANMDKLGDLNLNNYGNAHSSVMLDGVTAYLNATSFNTKLLLGSGGFTVVDGGSGSTYTFAGGVGGEGNFNIDYTSSPSGMNFEFSGDVKDWKGSLVYNVNKENKVVFKGGATEVNATITRTNGTLNMEVGDGTAFITTFNETVGASTLTIKNNASATFKETLTLTGSLTLDGSATLEKGGSIGGSIDLSHSGAAHGTLTLAAGQNLTYGSSFWGANNNKLLLGAGATVQKASGAPVTIEGLAVAEGEESYVSSSSNEQLLLDKSAFTLHNVKATINTASDNVQLRFDNSKLVTDQTITLKNLQSVFSGMDIQGGTTTVGASDLTESAKVTLGAVKLSGGNLTLADHVIGTVNGMNVTASGTVTGGTLAMQQVITMGANATLTLTGTTVDVSALSGGGTHPEYVEGQHPGDGSGFSSLSALVQLVDFTAGGTVTADGATFVMGSNTGTLILDDSANKGYVSFADASYNAYYLNNATATDDLSYAINTAAGHDGTVLEAVYLNAGTLNADVATTVASLHIHETADVTPGDVSLTGTAANFGTVSGKGTLNVDSATTLTADTLSIAADETLTLTGSEHISFGTITNRGTLDIGTGTKVATTNAITVGSGETFTTTGAGKLTGADLWVDGADSVVTLASEAEFANIRPNKGSLVVSGHTKVTDTLHAGENGHGQEASILVESTGVLDVNNISANWGFSSFTVNGALNVANELKLTTGNATYTVDGSGTITTKKLTLNNEGKYVFDGTNGLTLVVGEGGISAGSGGRTLTLANGLTVKASDDWTMNQDAKLNGTVNLNTQGNDLTISSVLSNAANTTGGLAITGGGTVALNGGNSFSGGLTVTGAGTTVVMGNQNALGNANNAITVENGATVDMNGKDNTIYNYTLHGGSLVNNGADTLLNHTQNASITLTADSTVGGSGKLWMIAGSWNATTATLNDHILTKVGTGIFSFVNTDVSSGTIKVNEGTVEFNSEKTHSRVQADIELNGGTISGAYTYKASDSAVIRNLTAKQDVTVDAAIEIGNNVTMATSVDNGKTLTMTGAITGTGNFSLSGTGTLALGNSINTTGDVTVAAGSAITFANGATITANSFGLGTGSKLDFSDYQGAIGSEIHVVTTTTGVTGYAGAVITGPTAPRGMQAKVEQKDKDIVLTFQAKEDATMHLYILTGQSNSMGTSKDVPLPQGMLDAYSTAGGMLWNGNMNKATQASPGGSRYVENPTWQGVLPQLPEISRNGKSSLCMGPEYGFTYMMLQKGWFSENAENDSLGVMKASLDGGGNSFWVKDGSISNYGLIVDSMQRAIKQADDMGYSTLSVDGLMYLQGESDGGDSSLAETRFAAFLENLTNDLDAWKREQGIDVALVFSGNAVTGENFSNNTTSQIFLDAATSDGKINADMNGRGHVLTKDLEGIGDGLHYTGNSQLTIGARYAYAFAVQKGINVGAVRGQDDSKNLNDAGAWWMEVLPGADEVATWDISSVSTVNNIAAGATLTVGGIKIDEVYHEGATAQGQGSIAINGGAISLGQHGINLVGGDLAITSAVSARESQTWQAANGHKLAVNGTTTIDTGATLKLADGLNLTFGYITGTGSLEIGTVTFDMDLDYMGTMAKASYISSEGEGANGYVNEANLIDLSAGDGTISFTHGGGVNDITKRGGLEGCTLTLGEDSKTLKVTMPSTAPDTVYFTRSGEVAYTSTDAGEHGIYNATELVLSGQQGSPATLTLSTALKDGVGIKAVGLGGTVKIDSNVVLNAASLETDGAPVTIAGSGEYVGKTLGAVGSVTAADVLGQGVTLANDWTGSVVLSGGNTSFSGYTIMAGLTDLYKAGSTIVFNGMYGYFDKDYTIGADIEFRGTGVDGTGAALTYTAGNQKTDEFSGTITGKGDFVFDKNGGTAETIKFTGNIAGWEGSITTGNHNSGPLNLTFGGSVTDVNAAITKGQNHPINVTVDATSAVSFNKALTGLSNLTLNANKSASVLGGIDTAATTLNGGASLTIGGTDTTNSLGTVTVNGTGSSLTINQAATITEVTLSNNASTTVTNNVAGTSLGNVTLNNNTALTIGGTAAVAAGNVKLADTSAASIILGNDFSVSQLDTIGGEKTLSIGSAEGVTKTLTTGALGFDNFNTVIALQNVNMVVTGDATVGELDAHSNNIGTMLVGSGATLNLQGTTQWNTGETKHVDLVISNGGAVNVTAGTENTLRGVNLGAGSSLSFGTGTSTTIGGAVVLANTITNDGSVTLTGTVNLDALTALTEDEGYWEGEEDTGNGFYYNSSTVRVFAEDHVGEVVSTGATITYKGVGGTLDDETGIFEANGEKDLTTFHAMKDGSWSSLGNAITKGETHLTTMKMHAGTGLTADVTTAVANLSIDADSATKAAHVADGTANFTNLIGEGKVDVDSEAVLNATNITVESGKSLAIGGAGALGITTINGAGTVNVDAATVTGGNVAINGGGTVNFGDGSTSMSFSRVDISGSGTSVTFNKQVQVTSERFDVGYRTAGTNLAANLKGGLQATYITGVSSYGALVGENATLTLGGTTDLGAGSLGIKAGGKLVIDEDASFSAAMIFNSASSNGDVEVREGAAVSLGNTTFRDTTITNFSNMGTVTITNHNASIGALDNSGTIALSGGGRTFTVTGDFANTGIISMTGASASSLAKLNVNNGDATLDMGAISLNNAELHIGSSGESRERNFSTITVDGAGRLTQNNWNNLMHITALNNGTGEGERSFTWQMNTNHYTNSVLYLDGEGNFNGTFTASRGNGSGNGAYQGHLQINDQQALQNAVLEVNGYNASNYMSVALNADKVETRGVTGNSNAIIYAGEADTSINKGAGRNAPVSTREGGATLAMNVADETTHEFAGKVESGISLEKSGAGTQVFSGDMSNFNGSVDVQAGELNIMNIAQASSLNVKDVTIAAGATMGVYNGATATPETASEGTLTMKAGNTLKAGGDNATLNANLVMEAGSVLEVSLAQATHGLTMGCTMALNTGDLLGDADLGYVQNLKFGEYYYLYNGVDSLSVNGTQYEALNFKDWTDFDMDASTVYTQLDEKRYALVYSWNGSNVGRIAITLIPEPTTGTLSLLALAALAARRRRK